MYYQLHTSWYVFDFTYHGRHEPNMCVSILTNHCLMPALFLIRQLLVSAIAPLCLVLEFDIYTLTVLCVLPCFLKPSLQVTREYCSSPSVHVAFPGAVVSNTLAKMKKRLCHTF